MKQRTLLLFFLITVCILLFAACGNTKDGMNYEVRDDGTVAITGYTDKTTVTELTVPDEIDGKPVTAIADFGICNAESLTKITIGKNVKEIQSWSMTNNQHLVEFVVDPANDYFTTSEGALFSKDMKTLYYYPCGRNIVFDRFGIAQNETTYEIPEGVETIAAKAFYKCYYVNITSFPDSITRIEEKAFHRASALQNFEMPKNLTYIGKDAFAYDEKLTNLTIPASIEEIGEYAFFNCTGMKRIFLQKSASDIVLNNKWQPTSKGKIMTSCLIGEPAQANPAENELKFPSKATNLQYYSSIDEKNPAVLVSFDLEGRHYEFASASEKVLPLNDRGDVLDIGEEHLIETEDLAGGKLFTYDSIFSYVIRLDGGVFHLYADFSDLLPVDSEDAADDETEDDSTPVLIDAAAPIKESFTAAAKQLGEQLS